MNKHPKIFSYHFIRVPVTDYQSVAVRNHGAENSVAVLRGYGGGGERTEVEEDAETRGGDEFGEELDEDSGGHVAGFVEEDAEACLRRVSFIW